MVVSFPLKIILWKVIIIVISSLIVKCRQGQELLAKNTISKLPGISVESILEGQLVLVLETHSLKEAGKIIEQDIKEAPGVLGAYPAYIHCGDEFSVN